MRLDRFVARVLPGLSRREIRHWFETGGIFLNDRPARKGTILEAGDVVRIRRPPDLPAERRIPPDPAVPLRVLYEDPFFVAVEKPAGIPSHPLRPGEKGTAANGLVARYPEMEGIGFSWREPGLLHRLDRETSGILLAARRPSAFEKLRGQFQQGRVKKVYLAVVLGSPEADGGVISLPLGARGRRSSRVNVLSPEDEPRPGLRWSSPAETRYRVLRRYRGYALVRLSMTGGVRHQLRAHMASLGHPIAGDRIYGSAAGAAESPAIPRHLLHAAEIRLFHPSDGRPLRIRSPLPGDFRAFLRSLEPG